MARYLRPASCTSAYLLTAIMVRHTSKPVACCIWMVFQFTIMSIEDVCFRSKFDAHMVGGGMCSGRYLSACSLRSSSSCRMFMYDLSSTSACLLMCPPGRSLCAFAHTHTHTTVCYSPHQDFGKFWASTTVMILLIQYPVESLSWLQAISAWTVPRILNIILLPKILPHYRLEQRTCILPFLPDINHQ